MNFKELSIILAKNSNDLALKIADDFVMFLNRNDVTNKDLNIAFSGGSTPKLLFSILANEFYQKLINWNKIHIFQVDERWVPQNHKDNNFSTLKELLLDKIVIPEDNIHSMPVTEGTIEETKQDYISTLNNRFGKQLPQFDLILLGMGDDGHTASIFPGESGKEPIESKEWVSVPFVEKLDSYRMTLSAKVLINSKHVWFLISGQNKAQVLHDVIYSDFDPLKLPSQIISKSNGKIDFYLDDTAYIELKKSAYRNSSNLRSK